MPKMYFYLHRKRLIVLRKNMDQRSGLSDAKIQVKMCRIGMYLKKKKNMLG